MALAERADLVARLSLDTRNFTGPLQRTTSALGSFTNRIKNSHAVSTALGVGLERVARHGIQMLFRGATGGLRSLADLEDAITSVDGAIKQMGLTGRLTGQQIADWANEIEAATDAAFDDKQITQAATTLIRFGKVTEDNLRPALVVMTDLATKTGDIDSAASLLAKALAAPEAAAGKLARTGIVLTDQQEEQIKAMVKAGKVAEAQAFLLDQLAKSTEGAAKASAGPYRDSLNILADVTEDVQRALGEGMLPLLIRVRGHLTEALGNKQTLENIRAFGKGLADIFDRGLDIAKSLPWQQIGDSLRIAGTGAKAVLDVFLAMPPWVQTAVLTGWGLNKLTGGAFGGIIAELGKGLIRGVLGIQAGVVNVTGRVVNAGGVAGGTAAAAGGGKTSIVASLVGGALLFEGLQRIPAGLEALDASVDAVARGDRLAAQKAAGQMSQAIGLWSPVSPLLRQISGQGARTMGAITRGADRTADAVERTRAAVRWGDMQVKQAINRIPAPKVTVNVSVRTSGDTIRVTKNYQTGTNLGRTGGPQEFD